MQWLSTGARHSGTREAGYTLYEIIVTITIIGVLTVIITQAYPTARHTHSLRLAEQQVQATLRQALTQALNEERHEDCVTLLEGENRDSRPCSDIGVHIRRNTMTLFADTHRPGKGVFSQNDFELTKLELVGDVEVPNEFTSTFVFEAQPPTVTLLANGEVVEAEPYTFTLRRAGAETELSVYPYGDVSHE